MKTKQIAFSTAPCPLGFLIIATSPAGVCWIALGDSQNLLETDLRGAFSDAQRDEAQLVSHTEKLLAYLNGDSHEIALPLDIQGTAFQQRVWAALRTIPFGQTRTYTEIAVALETPRGVRAVARACASNQIALAIPCHRVLRQSGDLAGFRWGLERKAALLELEKQAKSAS